MFLIDGKHYPLTTQETVRRTLEKAFPELIITCFFIQGKLQCVSYRQKKDAPELIRTTHLIALKPEPVHSTNVLFI